MALSKRLTFPSLISSLLVGCIPEPQVGMRPDAPPGRDAVVVIDSNLHDGGLDALEAPDAVSMDAPIELDAILMDAPHVDVLAADSPAPIDAPSDAGYDAGHDAAVIDAARDAGPVWRVTFCRIQYPPAIVAMPDQATMVYGRVYAEGLTTRTPMTDPDPMLVAEVGTGPRGTDPSSAGWVWTPASPNPGYGPSSPGHEPNNDEYQGEVSRSMPGVYDYAYRFSGDGGRTWVFCDRLDPGSSDGYQPENAGVLTVM